MTRRLAPLAIVFSICLALVAGTPAHAAGPQEAAHRGGTYLTSQVSENAPGELGVTIDTILALLATDDAELEGKAEPLIAHVRSQAPTYAATAPEAAARLAILANAVGDDPTQFGGHNVTAAIQAAVGADGAFGAQPGTEASSLAIVALARSGEEVPAPLVNGLLAFANADGGFGPAKGQPSDATSTGMALMALALAPDSDEADNAQLKGADWAVAHQRADGSWAGDDPVAATAMIGMGLAASGDPSETALEFLVAQQKKDGAFPGSGDGLTATARATMVLGGVTYIDVIRPLASASDAPAASPSASAAPTPTAPQQNAPDWTPLLIGAGVVALLAVGFWFIWRNRR